MNKKYSMKLVYDYVIGNDIDDYNIEYLEDDFIFMKQVIEYTKDFKMYFHCSERVQSDYEMIKFMLLTFSDLASVLIAEKYLKKTDEVDNIKRLELSILISRIIKNIKDIYSISEDDIVYSLGSYSFYEQYMLSIKTILSEDCSEEEIADFGMYFIVVLDNYSSSEIILNFFAEMMLRKIFLENANISFESLLHQNFSKEDLEMGKGYNSFIIDYISKFDSALSVYVSKNLGLLDFLKPKVKTIVKRWDSYIRNIRQQKIDIFYDKLEKDFENLDFICHMNYMSLIDYIIKKLNLEEIFQENYSNYEELDNNFNLLKYRTSSFDIKKLSFQELKYLKNILKFTRELFEEDTKKIIKR